MGVGLATSLVLRQRRKGRTVNMCLGGYVGDPASARRTKPLTGLEGRPVELAFTFCGGSQA